MDIMDVLWTICGRYNKAPNLAEAKKKHLRSKRPLLRFFN